MNPSNTEHYQNCVKEFMRAFDQKMYRFISDVPSRVLDLRASLINEEHKEYEEARTQTDILDAICDLIYVTAGAMNVCGIKAEPYSNVKPRYPFDLSAACCLVAGECRNALPCHRRMYRYTNQLLKLLEDCGSTYQLKSAFDTVHANNMEKLWGRKPEGRPDLIVLAKGDKYLVRDTSGKIIKPPWHTKPELSPFIPVRETAQ